GFSPEVAADLTTRPSVRTISEQRDAVVEINGGADVLSAFNTTTIATLLDFGHITGDLGQLAADGIAVEAETGPHAVQLGDTRTITFPTGPAAFTVRAIYSNRPAYVGNQFVDLRAFEAHLPVDIDSRIYVDAGDLTVVDRAAASYPTAKVLTTEAFIDQQNGTIDTILTLVYALLGLAVLIALLGIANTLALSIHERKRELGLLRAVGMSRAQVRSSVRWEAAIIAVFGTLLGLATGTFLGWAMVHAIAGQGIDRLVIPAPPLAIVATIAAIAAVGAAIMPARRAARIDILTAVATG
ncbi:MAG: putative transport system permease protein, partial [Ilumatobacteraceae bacterium]